MTGKKNNDDNLSKAAGILGSKESSPEEKSKAASELGKKGGAHSHEGGRPNNDNFDEEDNE